MAQNIQYLPFGPMKKLTYGNGLQETRGFDQQYRIASQLITKPGPTTVFSFTYTPDFNGNIENIHDNVQSAASQTFSYDDLDRLYDASTAVALYGQQTFGYDGVGNRELFTDNTLQSVLTYDTVTPSNRLQTITGSGAADFDYYDDGSVKTYDLIGERYLTFEYDDAAHLTRVLQRDEFNTDIEIVSYVYNSLGQRVKKQLAGGDVIYYWYGLDGELLAETDSGGATIIEYAYLNGAPLALLASDQDGDGMLDTDDNCITRQNTVTPNNQIDSNGDGFGNACDGDLNNDGIVNGVDLTIIQNLINAGTYNAAADLNVNGAVNIADKAILMSMFGQPPGPAGGGDGDALEKREYVLTDHRGAPFALSNSNKVTVWKANYEPFGYSNLNEDEDLDSQPVVLNLRYPGQYFDAETGLYYNWNRYYDPRTGRYISSDPIGLRGGLSTYGYALQDPLRYTDVTGLETCVVVTTTSSGLRDHSALYMSQGDGAPFLYDPSGSYARSHGGGTGDYVEGDAANLDAFAEWHKDSKVEKTCQDTSKEEERRLVDRIVNDLPEPGIAACAKSVSNALVGSPYFPNVEPNTWFPGNLYRAAGGKP